LQARDPAGVDARQELARLEQHHAWLRERLDRAQREKWDDDMVATIVAQKASTAAQLSSNRPTAASLRSS
jgi:hypothetical protein